MSSDFKAHDYKDIDAQHSFKTQDKKYAPCRLKACKVLIFIMQRNRSALRVRTLYCKRVSQTA